MESGNVAKKTNYLVFAVVLAYLLSQIVIEFIISKQWIERNIYYYLVFIQLFIILLPALLFTTINKMEVCHVLRLNKVKISEVLLVIVLAALSSFIASVLNSIVVFILGTTYSVPTGGVPIAANGSELFIQIIVVALIPSICEEIFFRGVIYHAFESMGTWKAIIVSSLYFSLFHFDIRNFLGPFFLGILIAWYCYRTCSIFAGIIAHFTNNFLLLLINWYSRDSAGSPLNLNYEIVWDMVTLALFTGIVIAILIKVFEAVTKNKVIRFTKSRNELSLLVITQWPMCFFYSVYIAITVLLFIK